MPEAWLAHFDLHELQYFQKRVSSNEETPHTHYKGAMIQGIKGSQSEAGRAYQY